MATANREVLFRFTGELDASVRKSLNDLAQIAGKVESQRKAAVKQTADLTKQLAREEAKEVQNSIRLANQKEAAAKAAMRSRVADAKAAAREEAKLDADLAKAGEKLRKEQNKRTIESLKQQEKEAVAAARAQENAQQKYARSTRQLERSLMGVGSATLGLARGLALMGIAGEENSQKLLQGLVKIEAAFSIFQGSVRLIQTGTRAWQAYRAAVLAAAAAQAVQAATAKGSAAGGVAGSAAGAAGGRVAGGALGGLAVAAAAPIAIGAAGAAAILGTIAIFNKDFRRGLTDLIGLTNTEMELREKFNRKLARQKELDDRDILVMGRAEALRRNREELFPSDPQRELAAAKADRQAAGRMNGGMSNDVLFAWRDQSYKRELAINERLLQMEQDKLDASKAAAAEKIRGAQEELRMTQQSYQAKLGELAAIRGQMKGAKARFGDMAPSEQQRILGIKKKMDTQGVESLNSDERQALRGLGLDSMSAAADRGSVAAADRGGWKAAGFDSAEQRRASQLKRDMRSDQDALNRGIKVDNNLRITLETDASKAAKDLAEQFEKQMAPVFERILKVKLEAMDRVTNNTFSQQEWQQRAASRTEYP